MTDFNDWNKKIIEEFHENNGVVGGPFEGAPLLLLHSTGAKSGEIRVNPMMYQQLSDNSIAVFASKGGAPSSPDWYYNLVKNPNASIEVGTETKAVVAHEAADAERDPIWEKQKTEYPQFAEYEEKTDRKIPVIVLTEA